MALRLLLLSLMVVGCSSDETNFRAKGTDVKAGDTGGAKDDGDPSPDTGGIGDDTGELIDPLPVGPCADGGWGDISEPESSLHVSLEATSLLGDWGDTLGAPGNPLTSAAELFEGTDGLATDRTFVAVAFWPGRHAVDPAILTRAVSAGLRVEACSRDEVDLNLTPADDHEGPLIVIDGGTADPADLWDTPPALTGLTLTSEAAATLVGITSATGATLSNIHLTGANLSSLIEIEDSSGIVLSGATLTGGLHALSVTDSQVTLSNLSILDSTVAGIWTTGGSTGITMDNVVVNNTSPGSGVIADVGGWGMFFEGGTVTGTNITVTASTGVGIMVDVGSFSLTDVNISNVAADSSGLYGRGIHLIDSECTATSEVSLTNITVEHVVDTGVFIQKVAQTSISNLKVANIGLGEIPDALGGGSAGDGLVVTGRTLDTAGMLSFSRLTNLNIRTSIEINTPDRAAIIVDNAVLTIDATAEVSGKLSDTDSTGAYIQNSATATSDVFFTDLGDGEDDFFPVEMGPHCLNLGMPSMSGGMPTVMSALSCTPF